MNITLLEKVFPNYMERVSKGLCPFCEHQLDISKFRDQSSINEAKISGLCQNCQDTMFGVWVYG